MITNKQKRPQSAEEMWQEYLKTLPLDKYLELLERDRERQKKAQPMRIRPECPKLWRG